MLIVLGVCCALIFVIVSFNKTSPEPATVSAPEQIDHNSATIQLGQTMIGELVKPGQTLIHVIQSPPETSGDLGQVCFVYYNSAIGSEYVLWNPNNQRTIVFHSNGLVEIIPSGKLDTWDGNFTPQFCKAGRDDNFKKIVRKDLL